MKQKNYRWLVYSVILGVLAAVLYVAFQDIMPVSRHVENTVEINFEK